MEEAGQFTYGDSPRNGPVGEMTPLARALAAQKELAETRAAAIEEALKQIAEAQETLKALWYKKPRQRKEAEPAAADTPKRKRGSKTA